MSALQVRIKGTKIDVHQYLEKLEKKHPFERMNFYWLKDCCYIDISFTHTVNREDIEAFAVTQKNITCCGVHNICFVP